MEIDVINEQIKNFSKMEPNDAKRNIDGLLEDLMKQDSFFILVHKKDSEETGDEDTDRDEKKSVPYMSSMYENGPLYMRLFTHREIAETFIREESISYEICNIDTIDSIWISKYWFLLGVPGFILNDGQFWVTVSFEQYLGIFYQKILEDSSFIDTSYIQAVYFINQLQNGAIPFSIRKKSHLYEIQSSGKIPLNYETFKKDVSRHPKTSFSFTENGQKFLLTGQQFQNIINEKAQTDFEDFSDLEDISGVYDYTKVSPYLRETVETAPIKPSLPSKRVVSQNIKKIPLKTLLKPIGLGLGIVVLLLIFFGASVLSSITAFKTNLANNDYKDAAIVYQKHADNSYFISHTNPYTEAKINEILQDYKEGKIKDEDVEAAYNNLTDLGCETSLKKARSDFYLIKNSKIAYKNGLNSHSSIQRLYYWTNVSQLDEENYKEIHRDFLKNQDKYLTNALTLVTTLSKYKKSEDISRIFGVLDSWYPNNTFVKAAKLKVGSLASYDISQPMSETSLFSSSNSSAIDFKAITINQIESKYAEDRNCSDLYISWTNCSGKTIRETDFYVLPIADDGNIASTNTDYQLYCARDIGPYKNNTGTPSENWAWKNVWNSNKIVSVNLTQIIIVYQDGSIQSIDNDISLQNTIA